MKTKQQTDPLQNFFKENAAPIPPVSPDAKASLFAKIRTEKPNSFWLNSPTWGLALAVMIFMGSLLWFSPGQESESLQASYVENSLTELFDSLETEEEIVGENYLALAEAINESI